MKKLFLTIILSTLSAYIFPQSVDNIIANFAGQECAQFNNINEEEWKYAKYVFSKIAPPFYDLEQTEQIKDSINNFWFEKVFTYKNEDSYSLDFAKIKTEAAQVNLSDIPDVNEFIFIGMKIPLLEKAHTITHLELKDCPIQIKNNFRQEFEKVKEFYEVLIATKDEDTEVTILKNKDTNSFSELIMLEQSDPSHINLMKLTGSFDISDISAPKDYDELN